MLIIKAIKIGKIAIAKTAKTRLPRTAPVDFQNKWIRKVV